MHQCLPPHAAHGMGHPLAGGRRGECGRGRVEQWHVEPRVAGREIPCAGRAAAAPLAEHKARHLLWWRWHFSRRETRRHLPRQRRGHLTGVCERLSVPGRGERRVGAERVGKCFGLAGSAPVWRKKPHLTQRVQSSLTAGCNIARLWRAGVVSNILRGA